MQEWYQTLNDNFSRDGAGFGPKIKFNPCGTLSHACVAQQVVAHPSGKMSTYVGSIGRELPPSTAKPADIYEHAWDTFKLVHSYSALLEQH